MTLLYLRYRARMAWSRIQPGSRKDWGQGLLLGLLVLVNLPILALLYWGFHALFTSVAQTLGLDALQRLLHLPVAAFGFSLFFLVLNRVHPVLFESADDELVRSLPVTASRLTQARLTGLAVLLSPSVLLLLPLAVFFGLASDAAFGYHVVATCLVALFALAVLALGALATLLLALCLPARPLRGLSRYGTLAILLPTGFAAFVLMPTLPRAQGVTEQMLVLADVVAVGPVAWFVQGLARAAAADLGAAVPTAALLAVAAGTWSACLALAPRLQARHAAAAVPQSPSKVGGLAWWAPAWLDGAGRALWRRELTAIRSEAPRALLMPIAFIVFFALLSRFSSRFLPLPVFVGWMCLSLVAGLTLAAIGQEGRAFWILRSLPIPMWKVLAVKLAVRLSVALATVAGIGAVFAGLSAFDAARGAHRAPVFPEVLSPRLRPWVLGMFLLGLVISGLWGLATGARFPRFDSPRKGQYTGTSAGLIGIFGPLVVVGTLVLSLMPLQVEALRPVLWFLPLAVPAFWLGACALYLAWAVWYLERLET